MTDHAAAAAPEKPGHTTPKKGLTAEQIAALSTSEKEELIAELEAALVELRRPAPQPYPKWVEIDGVPQIVESEEEEQRKTKAAADFRKTQDEKADSDSHNKRRER
jgi:hypothetical protein